MAITATPVFVQTPSMAVNTISTTTGVSAVTVVTGSTNGSKVVALSATNNTTVAALITVSVSTGGGTAKRFGIASVPLSTDGTTPPIPATDLFSPSFLPGMPIDNDGQHYLLLPSSVWSLTVTATAALSTTTSGRTVDFFSVYGDF